MTESTKSVVIHTDGSCLGNPGPGAYCAVLSYAGSDKELVQGYRLTTNNRMEILAVIVALEALTEPCKVDLYTDSQYVKNAVTKRWLYGWQRNGWVTANKQPVKNQDLWRRMLPLLTKHKVDFHWVRGHSGHPENERCDRLARSAATGRNLADDTGYVPGS